VTFVESTITIRKKIPYILDIIPHLQVSDIVLMNCL